MDDFLETLLHGTYVLLVALESEHNYRFAAAALFGLALLHLWRHKRDYLALCKRPAWSRRWFKRREG